MKLPARIPDLVARIRERAPRGPGEAELWVLVPSYQLLRATEQALCDAGEALVGVRLMTLDAALEAVAELVAGTGAPRPVAGRVATHARADLLFDTLRALPSADLDPGMRAARDWLLRFPDTRLSLLGTVETLADLGLAPGAELHDGSATGRLVVALHAAYEARLAALEAGPAPLIGRARLFHHGLAPRLATLDPGAGIPVLAFLPGPRLQPLLGLLVAALEEHVAFAVERIEHGEAVGPIAARAATLVDADAEVPAEPLEAERLHLFTAQGEEEELREAVHRARALVAAGARPDRVAIVAPSLEPYLPHLQALADGEGLPLDPWVGRRPVGEPLARLALRLLRFVLDGEARADLVELLGHPCLRREVLGPAAALCETEALALLDRATRGQGCTGGREELRDAVRREAEERGRQDGDGHGEPDAALVALLAPMEHLDRVLGGLAEALAAEHQAAALVHALTTLLAPRDAAETDLRDLLVERVLGLAQRRLLGLDEPLAPRALLRWLELAFEEPWGAHPAGTHDGVALLPLERLHGLDCDHLFLIGFARGLFPGSGSRDAFLTDDDLRALRGLVGGGVPTGSLATAEEALALQRLDLAAALAAARETVTLSWPRADLGGKPRAPSVWLRLVGRALVGVESVERLLARTGDGPQRLEAVPFAPRERLARRAARGTDAPLSRREALCLAGLEGGFDATVDLARGLAGAEPDDATRRGDLALLERAAAQTKVLDGFVPGRTREVHAFDALFLPPLLDACTPLSPTLLEDLGRCPLRAFFGHVLEVAPLPPEPDRYDLDPRRLGQAMHAILRALLADEREAIAAEPEAALARMRGRVATEIDHRRRVLLSGLARRVPLLAEESLTRWKLALERVLELDLAELGESGLAPAELESAWRDRRVRVGGGAATTRDLELQGRIDRLDRSPAGARIVDYKSGPGFAKDGISWQVLKGQELQLPVYMLMLAAVEDGVPRGELRGLHPEALRRFAGALPRRRVAPALFEGVALDGLRETLGVLCDLLDRGHLPLRSGRHCGTCEFQATCPRHHAPTSERLAAVEDLAAFRGLRRKGKDAPLLAMLGPLGDDDADEEDEA